MSTPNAPFALAARATRTRRRRITGFAAFGAVGILLSATWAAGITSQAATTSSATVSTSSGASAPSTAAGRFGTKITADDPLVINFEGRWGAIPNDPDNDAHVNYELFNVDLSDTALFPANTNYFIEVGLGTPEPAGFSALQIPIIVDDDPCSAPTWGTAFAAGAAQLLRGDNLDNVAAFSSLPGGDQYCVGVAPIATANVSSGAFIRRAFSGATFTSNGTDPGVPPTFTVVVNQHS